ncbi:hypothetical protein CMI48_00370 [Candidatus Pacearchaeota archaeon]|nr:hypothetical protein [Candidatus Pacearchaeota archaeon]
MVNPENGENETLTLPDNLRTIHDLYSHDDHIWATASARKGSKKRHHERAVKVKEGAVVKTRVLGRYIRAFDKDTFYTVGSGSGDKMSAHGSNGPLWECEEPLKQGWPVAASDGFVHYRGYEEDLGGQHISLISEGKEISRTPLFESSFLFAHGPTAYLRFGGGYIGNVEGGRGHGFVAHKDLRYGHKEIDHTINGNDLYLVHHSNPFGVFHAKIGRKQLVDAEQEQSP